MSKELTIEEKLSNLYDLQKIDSSLDEINILKGELPMEVSYLEDEIAGLEVRAEKLKAQIAEIEEEISNHNRNIKDSTALIERYNTQLDDVKNNREFEALTKEIELQSLEIQLSEKRIKEHEIVLEGKNLKLNDTAENRKAQEELLVKKKEELEKIIEKTEKEEAKLEKKRESERSKIPERLLRSYDRIRSQYKNGLAVVTVQREACGGCYNKIPPQTVLELNLRSKIVPCEFCGRVLIDDELAGVVVE